VLRKPSQFELYTSRMPLGQKWTRRTFLRCASAAGLAWSWPSGGRAATTVFPVHFRKASPYELLRPLIESGHDDFAVEREAEEIEARWDLTLATRAITLAESFRGVSPVPARYRQIAEGVFEAEFDPGDHRFEAGMKAWIASLGQIRNARFFALPGDRLRFEIASTTNGLLNYRVGAWKQVWRDGRLAAFEPVEESLVTSPRPLFQDVTSQSFGTADSFRNQLLRGIPYWRGRLDSASGIDVFGNNGIAVGDIDGDGRDEVYVCQPAGLPNRLYKVDADGRVEDITEHWGAAVLDDSTAALFLDLRNSGRQDLVVLTTSGPLLFLNDGAPLRHKPDAFRFASEPQGTFTGMSAADYDRDGRLDLYLCTYVYFQSEDQYRYPAPYHDAQNGPPNFLFANRLSADGAGFFEDVTSAAGLDENNNRYSFAPAWCDYNGDGWPDLYVANDFGRNNLYKNEGGRFHDLAAAAGVEDIGPGMSAAWFDYDGDARPDLYVSNMWTASGQRLVADVHFEPVAKNGLKDAYRRHTKGNSLYRNRGDGTFAETEFEEGVAMGRWAWASDGFDFDNDGAPEIYIACGMLTNPSATDAMSFFWRQVVGYSPAVQQPSPKYEKGWNAINQFIREDVSWNGREPNVLYARRGSRFYDFSGISGADFAEDTRAFAVIDFDHDGNPDLILKSRLGPQLRLLRNEWGAGARSIAIRLTGGRSNRDAIGASVQVEWAGRRTVRFVQAGSGYLSQHTKTLHFGLGDVSQADRLVINWPSGLRQEFRNVEAGFRYHIAEGNDQLRREAFASRQHLRPSSSLQPVNAPTFEDTWLLRPVPIPEKRRGPGFVLLTPSGDASLPAGIPGEVLDLSREPPDVAAAYALFRRYLFDYRTDLLLPMLILIDERGLAHKVYRDMPAEATLRKDLQLLREPDRMRLALPFAGAYYAPPKRNYFRLGSAFFWAGYPDQALIYLNEVIRENPDNGKAHLATGFIHMEAGRDDEARRHLERAVELLPKSTDAWTYLGRLEMNNKRYHEALADFQRAFDLDPNAPYTLMSAGQAQTGLGDDQSAESLFRRALAADNQEADAANQLGLLLARHNRTDEARQYFEQAIAAQRDHVWAINNLGVLYVEMHKPNDAVAAFRYGIDVAPDEEISYTNLARFYARAGDLAKARNVLHQLLTRHPASSAALKGLHELGE
jgi:Flp pilus assembly protein TadD